MPHARDQFHHIGNVSQDMAFRVSLALPVELRL
jgi:hypothetical protein